MSIVSDQTEAESKSKNVVVKYGVKLTSARKKKICSSITDYFLGYGVLFLPEMYNFRITSTKIKYRESLILDEDRNIKGRSSSNSSVMIDLDGRTLGFPLNENWEVDFRAKLLYKYRVILRIINDPSVRVKHDKKRKELRNKK